MVADIAILVLVTVLTVMGWHKGLLSQILTLGSIALLWFTKATWLPPASVVVAQFGPAFADNFFLRDMAASLLLFLLLLLGGWILEHRVIRRSKLLRSGNSWSGAVLGLAKGLAYGVVLLWLAQTAALWGDGPEDAPPAWTQESLALQLVGPLNPVRVMTLREIVDRMSSQTTTKAGEPSSETTLQPESDPGGEVSEKEARRRAIEGSKSLQELVDAVRNNPEWGTQSYTELMNDPRVKEVIEDSEIGKLLFGE